MNIYLVYNNYITSNIGYEDNDLYGFSRVSRPLSIKGEEIAKKIANINELKNVDKIYSSTYSSSIGTAKYLSELLNKPINVTKLVNERKIGILNDELSEFNMLQEHNFDYKLKNGESINDVKKRSDLFLKQVMTIDYESNVIVFTHDSFIKSLLMNYCHIGYNLNKRLILEYDNVTIMDEKQEKYSLIKLEVIDKKIRKIEVIV